MTPLDPSVLLRRLPLQIVGAGRFERFLARLFGARVTLLREDGLPLRGWVVRRWRGRLYVLRAGQ